MLSICRPLLGSGKRLCAAVWWQRHPSPTLPCPCHLYSLRAGGCDGEGRGEPLFSLLRAFAMQQGDVRLATLPSSGIATW